MLTGRKVCLLGEAVGTKTSSQHARLCTFLQEAFAADFLGNKDFVVGLKNKKTVGPSSRALPLAGPLPALTLHPARGPVSKAGPSPTISCTNRKTPSKKWTEYTCLLEATTNSNSFFSKPSPQSWAIWCGLGHPQSHPGVPGLQPQCQLSSC